MSKTHRRQPTRKENKVEKLEREFMAKNRRVRMADDTELTLSVGEQASIEQAKAEAEFLINERAQSESFSVQSPSTDDPIEVGGGMLWWTGGSLDSYIPLSAYGNRSRMEEIRTFALLAPMILNAEAILAKKVTALQWTVDGGRNLAQKWQRKLNNFGGGAGWDTFIMRWVRAYCESDQPAYSEIIRAAPSWAVDEDFQLTERGEAAIANGDDKVWEIVDARVMDPVCCFPTTSSEFPLVYRNPHTGKKYQLRPYQFMSLVDQPGVDDRLPGSAVCAVTRAVYAAQADRMETRYSMEKMSENPGAGLAVVNASQTALRTAMLSATAEREARGVVYYKGIIFLPIMDPSGSTKLEFLSFSELPEGWNLTESYQKNKEIVATAFGLDVLEFGSISGRMGTGGQAKVAAQKSRTKTLGSLMQGMERAFRHKILPESIQFDIKKYDEEEERLRAERDQIFFNNAIRLAQFAPDPSVPIQYLVDKGALPNEPPYTTFDYNPNQEFHDTTSDGETDTPQGERPEYQPRRPSVGPDGTENTTPVKSIDRVRIDRDGKITSLTRSRSVYPFQVRRHQAYP